VIYWLKEAWADGSKCFTFEPLDFIAKLLPLIPPPRVNLTRYHGAWAAHSAIREKVVPNPAEADRRGQLALPLPRRKKPKKKGGASATGGGAGSDYRCGREYPVGARAPRLSWSELSAKTFSVDTLACERCGYSPLRVVAVAVAPTREQLEAVRHPGAVFAAVSWRSRVV